MMVSRKLLMFLLVGLMMITSVSAANWYVDNAATGSNSGISWANAWNSFASIGWSSIQPGDVVYISGGSTSKTYNEQMTVRASGSPGNLITIRAGVDAGHNGRVILDGQSTIGHGIAILGMHTDGYIKVQNLEFQYFTNRGQVSIRSENPTYGGKDLKHIVIESNKFRENRGHGGIFAGGYNWGGRRSYLSDVYIRYNEFSVGDSQNGRDNIYVADASNIFIHGNTIIGDNDITDKHDDNIQFVRVHNSVITNNYMYEQNIDEPNQVFMWEGISGTHIIYNNVFYSPNMIGYRNTFLDKDNPYPKTYYFIHNTVYGGSNHNLFNLATTTDAYTYNNIFYNSAPGGGGATKYAYPLSSYLGDWSLTDGNLYGNYQPGTFYAMSMDAINALGAETSGTPSARYLVDPLFVSQSTYPNEDLHLQSGSPAINAGVDVQALVESLGLEWTDINGNPRDSTPDIGAYEFGGIGCPPPPPCGAPPPNGCQYTYEIDENGCQVCGELVCTGPDLNGDGCIDLGEIVAYVELWQRGQISLSDVVSGVEKWQQGC